MNPRNLFCYALPAFYMAALSLYGQSLLILPVTIAPGKASPVVVNTFPGAACSLNATGDAGTPHNMAVYANDQGQVRFYVQAQAASIAPAALDLQCNSGTQTVNYHIKISASAATPPTGATLAAETGTVRPPLAGNPLAPSQPDLMGGNYPLRPDPVQAPEAYATWLRMVSTPTTVIKGKLIEQPNRFHVAAATSSPVPPQPVAPATAYSQYWSGLVLYQDPRTVVPFQLPPYDFVSAEWYVPAVTGAPNSDVGEASAFWTGMDGWDFGPKGRDVLQGGTEQDVFTVTYQGILFTITNYYAWFEFFPSSEQLITNFNVGPGDHLVVQVFMVDSDGVVDINAPYGFCYMQNLTTGYAVRATLNSSRRFSGNSAEFVMERPVSIALTESLPGGCCETQYLGSLANYSAATMLNAYAIRTDSTVVNASGNLDSLNVTMTTLGDQNSPILSEVVPLNDTSMVFRWKGAQ